MPDCRHVFLDHLCLDPVASEQAAQQIMFPLPAFPQQVVLHYRGLKKTTIFPPLQVIFPSLASPQQLIVYYRGLTQTTIYPPQQIMFPLPAFPQQVVVHFRGLTEMITFRPLSPGVFTMRISHNTQILAI